MELRARARVRDVIRRRAHLVGARLGDGRPGVISPLEAPLLLGLHLDDPVGIEREQLARGTALRSLGVLVSTLIAWLIAPSRRRPALARPYVVSAAIDNLTADEAIAALVAPPTTARARVVHFAHPHALNLAVRDAELRAHLARADLVLGDGVGLRLGAALLGARMRANLNGTDLLPALCRAAAASALPLVLIGGAPGVAATAAARLREDTPGLDIPVVAHGFLDDAHRVATIAAVAALPRVLVLVGMGSPLQERFAWQHLAALRGATVVTVGGLFDFYSGRVARAPLAWRRIGLEWLYRLAQEPRRLARRYLVGNPLFMLRVLVQRARRRSHAATPPGQLPHAETPRPELRQRTR